MRRMICSIRFWGIGSLLAAAFLLRDGYPCLSGDDGDTTPQSGETVSAKDALAEFNDLIGGWRGTGQPRRGSARGAWQEDAEWVWKFGDGATSIRCDVTDGKLMKSAELTWDPDHRKYQLATETPEGKERAYVGALDGDRLAMISRPDEEGYEYRITVTRLNRKRTLVLFEKRHEGRQSFSRIAEVGYTREGTRLATSEGTGPECVVTGGTGTIPVMYKGKMYYVCCTGCRQAFEDDPEGIIAEYEARLAKRRAEAGENE